MFLFYFLRNGCFIQYQFFYFVFLKFLFVNDIKDKYDENNCIYWYQIYEKCISMSIYGSFVSGFVINICKMKKYNIIVDFK